MVEDLELMQEEKEIRQSCVWGGHASSLQLVLSKETRESLSERCLSNKLAEVGCQQLSTATQSSWKDSSHGRSVVTHVCAKLSLPCGPHPQHYSERPEGRKRDHTKWIWGQPGQLLHLWELAGHPTELDRQQNKGQVRPKPWKWVTIFVTHTHTLVRRDNSPFTILQFYLHLFRFFMNICV